MNIGILFTVGGDRTLRGASALSEEIGRRKLKIAVIGIPKTIDKDISYIQRSFGFATAVSEAGRAITSAHVEALGARNGIGLVKLMGRESGFIATYAALAYSDVNFCLIPEVPFTLGSFTGVFPAGAVPSQSQLYSYIAPSTDALLADEGDLWAFVSDTPGVKNYYHVLPNSGTVVTGHFIKVPKDIATGKNADGSSIKAADKGYPLPPTNGSWQLDLRSATPTGLDGPQWVLEYWSDINNVFQFVRIEDIAYDKRPGMGNVVYIVDSGRGRTAAQSLDTAKLQVHERTCLEDGA